MGRFAPTQTTTGTVKTIQHIGATLTSNATQNIAISAVSSTNKAYIISNGESTRSGGGAGFDVKARSGHFSSEGGARITSTTNVAVTCANADMWSGYTFYTSTGYYRGAVIEVT